MMLILTILISTVFLNQKVNAATTDGKYISSMAPNENLTNKYNFDYNKGGFYTEFYNNYENKNWYFSPISFENNIYNNVYVPITISDPNSILSITKNQNGPDIIKELGASISVRAIWNEGWLSWCYSTEISKNNNSVLYKCNVPNTRTSLKGLNIHIADTSTGADILDSVVTVGVGDTFDFEISSNKTNEDIKNEIIKDHEYNNNESKDTTEQENEINNYEKKEDNLRNGLNLDIESSEITINPNANNFIWETINKLRGMSSKIVLLFTSVLSLGLMKMILGR